MKDGKLITAGKGVLIQIEKSATLGTSQDQTLFAPVKSICLNDQGGAVMNVSIEKAATLRAQTHGHELIVLQEKGAKDAERGCPTEKVRGCAYP